MTIFEAPARRRVLIVVSAYQPAMIADMQRARMLAWELPALGWDVEVLSPHEQEIRQDVIEPNSSAFFPAETIHHRVGSSARMLFQFAGSRTHGWRTLWPIYARGSELLRTGRFDLVYMSTTTFQYFALAAEWRRRLHVPYVLDFHDPWVKENGKNGREHGLRGKLLSSTWRTLERRSVANADGIVAVSPHYIDMLQSRYSDLSPSWMLPGRHAVIPFGVLENDLREAEKSKDRARQSSKELAIHYVGAGGAIMARSFRLLCQALGRLRQQRNPSVDRIRIRLFGTMYGWAPGDRRLLQEVACEAGVGELVEEFPERVSYRQSLEILVEGDGALILGVDDAGYMPSKLFSYALSGKPLLGLFHRESPAFARFQENPLWGHVLYIDRDQEMDLSEAASTLGAYLEEVAERRRFDRSDLVAPHTARSMAEEHAALFGRICSAGAKQ